MAEDQNNAANQPDPVVVKEPKKKKSMIKVAFGIIIVLVIFGGGYTLLKDATFTGSNISTSDLVEETAEGLTFKRPGDWTKVDSPDADLAYTEGGEDPDDTDQGVLISKESLGIDYTSLTTEQKSLLSSQFKSQFSDASSLENGSCNKVENVNTAEVSRSGYDTSFTVEAQCTELEDRPAATATIKMVIGVSGEDLHLMALVALDETWEKSGEALEAVLASLKPVE